MDKSVVSQVTMELTFPGLSLKLLIYFFDILAHQWEQKRKDKKNVDKNNIRIYPWRENLWPSSHHFYYQTRFLQNNQS